MLAPAAAAAAGLWLIAQAAAATGPGAGPNDGPNDGKSGPPLRFITCPVYRDTVNARKSGCWLATDLATGQRYDLQQAPTKPQLGQPVLVEAAVPNQPEADVCGAVVLKPVRVSVMPGEFGHCPAVVLPAEGYPGKRFELPGSVMTPNHLPQPQPAAPYRSRSFVIEFDWGDDYLRYQHAEVILQQAVRLAQLGRAQRIVVDGYAATQPVAVSGQLLAEPAALAQARAQMVAEALRRLGWPVQLTTVLHHSDPAPLPDAPPPLQEASKRRVTLQVAIDGKGDAP